MQRPIIKHTVDLDRVNALPRRVLDEGVATMWADYYSDEYALRPSARLRQWQAQCLAEAVENLGGWFVLGVGFGKTLVSSLLPLALNSLRPILIVPAGLRDKTYADFASYRGVWRSPSPPPQVFSREELALDTNRDLLDRFQPDLIIIDEADEFANADSAAATRIDRYVQPRTREEVAVVCLTGTPSRNSIMAYWHILCWCLREDAPVPMTQTEARMWAAALDNQGPATGRRVLVGPLDPSGTNDLKRARVWFQKRLAETPGVIVIDGDSAGDVPLTIRTRLAKECPKLDAHFTRFMVDQENPDGMPCAAPLDRWRVDRFLGCGLFMRYKKPGPPVEWIEKRRARGRAYAALCRTTIKGSRSWSDPKDTDKQVRKHFARKPDNDPGRRVIALWDEVADDPYPKEAVWLSTATIETAVEWLRASPDPGIIWTGCVEFGEALAVALRLPYFGPKGKDKQGNCLDAISRQPAWHKRSFVSSWNANKKGFNLQPWRRNAVIDPPTSAKWNEQLYGRAHRSMQDRPVSYDVIATSGGTLDAFEASIAEARFAKITVGPTQKILRAKIERAPRPKITTSNRFRWARRDDE